MNQHVVSSFLADLNLCIIFIFFFLFQGSMSLDYFYEACVPKDCGDGPNISYPFYIQGVQESFCGYPGFALNCGSNGYPILRMNESYFVVRDIYYNSSSARLVNAAAVWQNSTNSGCFSAIKNTTFDSSQFEFDNVSNSDLVLFSNCSEDLPTELRRFRIGSCVEGTKMVMLRNDTNLGIGMGFCSGGTVVVPVDIGVGDWSGVVLVDGRNYVEVMRRGFMTRWLAKDCGRCERSGGRCGFNETFFSFRCFCHDRPHMVSCPPPPFVIGKRNLRLILVSALGAGAVLLLLVMFFYFRKKFVRSRKTQNYLNVEAFLKNHEFLAPKRYSYQDIKKMTDSFKVKLGQGGYGSVYKGKLSNDTLVAVKIMNEAKGNGEDFINEVASVGRTSHVNIVSLLGFCFERSRRALIYEFMANGSLEKFIHDRSSVTNHQLEWEKLYQIVVGIARGLQYLHRGCNTRILHFDIKPHNILLDQDFCPKISDFGLAKLDPQKRSIISMSGMRGTPGYIAPEVFSRNFGEISSKSDVYSYGMMVLEMVGWKNTEVGVEHSSEIYFPNCIYKKLEADNELGLHGIVHEEENQTAKKMTIVGLWCIQTNPLNRPTITKVLDMLEGGLELLEIPPKPYLSSPLRSVDSLATD